MVSIGLEWKSALAWFCVMISYELAVKMTAKAAVVWRLDWGWKIHFQDGLIAWPASHCWILARGFNS